tara:strand:- start:1424 stop:1891 length:468 start_codon:yes stop_codon:yes gene_type:complete
MVNDGIKVRGDLSIVLRGADGEIKDERLLTNLVVTDGLNLICSRLKDATANAPSHMGIGTGTTAAAAGDSALGTEASGGSYARQSVGTPTLNTTNKSIQFQSTFGAGVGTGAITESGIFNASTSGDMLARVVFSAVNKGASDSLQITHTITLSAS